METATAVLRASTEALQISGQGSIEELLQAWAAQLDCAASSRMLYTRALRQFFVWVQRTGRVLSCMGKADIIAYKEGLLNGTASTDGTAKSTLTTASYLTAVKLFYKWMHSANGLLTDIAEGVKLPKRQNKFEREPLTNEQAHELTEEVATASLRDAAIINLLIRTGMRTIEASRANIEDLQVLSGQVVLYVQGKGHTGKDNFVVVSDKCRQAIACYLATRPHALPSDPLFACDSNNNLGGRLTTRTISGIVKRHLQAIGLDGRAYTAHSLRHTFGTRLLKETNDFNLVQLSLRHASPATTQKYTYHIDAERRIEAARLHSIDMIY